MWYAYIIVLPLWKTVFVTLVARDLLTCWMDRVFGLDISYIIILTFQVQTPIVCGISSLGYDHTEILGKCFISIVDCSSWFEQLYCTVVSAWITFYIYPHEMQHCMVMHLIMIYNISCMCMHYLLVNRQHTSVVMIQHDVVSCSSAVRTQFLSVIMYTYRHFYD